MGSRRWLCDIRRGAFQVPDLLPGKRTPPKAVFGGQSRAGASWEAMGATGRSVEELRSKWGPEVTRAYESPGLEKGRSLEENPA